MNNLGLTDLFTKVNIVYSDGNILLKTSWIKSDKNRYKS